MTSPGGSSGEHEHPAEQSIYDSPWAVPGAAPAGPAPLDYPPDGAAGYPPPYPPPMPPPYGGHPGGYYPGWEYAAGYGTPRSGTNKMAITALVASILGVFCCVGSIVGVVCGNVALSQIKRTREDGHGLAVGGIVISVVTLLFYFFVVGLGVIGA
ncbi:DUF4190 domain-containing protein [Mycobacterium asiaticum]|uniref:DUF4190 domain-containing protein n=1 Tax=Mycobacterium asiaticum TaxID=1790 RepID=A0A1A3BHB6_MYCAS|nr:DUF4190 domain-containing protein [Mycobacterium asiaticum]OBI73292.1 hypothetical protein A9X01_06670 [Mycobacterium asiaticum]